MGRLYQLTYTLKAPCVYGERNVTCLCTALEFWEDFQTNQATTNILALLLYGIELHM